MIPRDVIFALITILRLLFPTKKLYIFIFRKSREKYISGGVVGIAMVRIEIGALGASSYH